MNQEHEAATIIALERAALERWGRGDPSGYLELSSPDVTYFDHQTEQRLDGLTALTRLYEACRGAIQIEWSEMPNPRVRFCGNDAAVLTFNFNSRGKGGAMRWNCTEVYERHGETWRIVQTHWSLTRHGS